VPEEPGESRALPLAAVRLVDALDLRPLLQRVGQQPEERRFVGHHHTELLGMPGDQLERGDRAAVAARPRPLEETARAHAMVEGGTGGRVVIRIATPQVSLSGF
jgi:hypothetical protein